MVNLSLIDKLFRTATMLRWNDHIRPIEFTELDKQSHKAIIAFVLAKFEEDFKEPSDKIWIELIEGGIFEFLQRAVLTDLKPPLIYRLMKKESDRIELNNHVIKTVKSEIKDLEPEFIDDFEKYLAGSKQKNLPRRILEAAHYLATDWEFRIIYNCNPHVYGLDRTKEDIENTIEDHYDLIGVKKVELKKRTYGFIDLCGQLRFQRRWSQTPRIPPTSVLGHMYLVGIMSYLYSKEVGENESTRRNTFYSGLFHDLPEVLTRDVINPIKKNVQFINKNLEDVEKSLMEEKLLPLLPSSWHWEIRHLAFNPKMLRYTDKDKETQEFVGSYDDFISLDDEKFPNRVDGSLISGCDTLTAFMEATASQSYGIDSKELQNGRKKAQKKLTEMKFGKIDFGIEANKYSKLLDEISSEEE